MIMVRIPFLLMETPDQELIVSDSHLTVQILLFLLRLMRWGAFIDQLSIDVSDNGFDDTNSRIFFGGSNEATFNNF